MDPLQPSDPPSIGAYRLLSRLGAGGMGQVYLARTASGRRLVVKVIRPELAHEDGFRARFAREADAARRVGGFHTAQVVDADPHADAPWIATAHIPGPSLGQAVRGHGPLDPSAAHVLATGLAEGLQAIHALHLVHRDLKPGNIILADDGPRIIDFGIARPLDTDSMTTRGAVFGTLPYMSPEQTENSRVGPASDVFSLGTVLAFALTGTNPFAGDSMAETLRRIIGPPPDPGPLDPPLRSLIVQCWDHDPDRRPTPEQILTLFGAEDPHGSWPPPAAARPAPVGGPALPSSALAPGTLERPPAAPSSAPLSATAPPGGRPPIGRPTPPPNTAAVAPAPFPAPRANSGGQVPRRKRWPYYVSAVSAVAVVGLLLLWVAGRPYPAATLRGHDGAVATLAFSPDGATLATGSDDGTARLWDTDTGETITTFSGHDRGVSAVAFGSDGSTLATSSYDGTARLWDTGTGEEVAAFDEHGGEVLSVALSPDGSTLATSSGYQGAAQLWETDTGEAIATLTGHGMGVSSLAFSPDGTILATGSSDGTARLWESGTGEAIATFDGHDDWVSSVAFSPDGSTLATGGHDDTARLWEIATGVTTAVLRGHDGRVSSVAFGPDGSTLATGGDDNTARLWDTDTGEEVATFGGTGGGVSSVAVSPDGVRLAAGFGADGTVRWWELD